MDLRYLCILKRLNTVVPLFVRLEYGQNRKKHENIHGVLKKSEMKINLLKYNYSKN